MKKDFGITFMVAFFTVTMFLTGASVYKAIQTSDQAKASTEELKKATQAYADKKAKIEQDVYAYAKNNGSPEMKSIANHCLDESALKGISKKFFKIAFTYGDSKSYLARRSEAKEYATPSVVANRGLFGNGTKSSAEIVDTLNVSSRLENLTVFLTSTNGNVITGKAMAQYEMSTNGNQKTGTKTYSISYNTSLGKIVNVNELK